MSSLITPGSPNWVDVNTLRAHGVTMPQSRTAAKVEAANLNAAANNRTLTSAMNRSRMQNSRMAGIMRTGANVQMALPKVRQPLSSLTDKGIPFNVEDPKELQEIRKWCNTPEAPVWMGDFTFKPMGEITVGEEVVGWINCENIRGRSGRRKLVKSRVLAVNRRIAPEVVKITFESGRTVKCTPDHEWLKYYPQNESGDSDRRQGPNRYKGSKEYAPLELGSLARHVVEPVEELTDPKMIHAAGYLSGIIDGEGNIHDGSVEIHQSLAKNPDVCSRIQESMDILGLQYRVRELPGNPAFGRSDWTRLLRWDFVGGRGRESSSQTRQSTVKLINWCNPSKLKRQQVEDRLLTTNFGTSDRVVSIESLGPGEVVSMQTETGNYTAWGFASKNCRLFYATHDLVPLLIDIYSKFPVVGMEFASKDTLIQKFYEQMFMEDLNYMEFLPDSLGREYFTVGEVNSLAHFNESLGIWSSEEILNPDTLHVSKSLFVERERVQLMVKDMVDALREGPDSMRMGGTGDPAKETPSERKERLWQYEQLQKYYPEIVEAAAQEDGLDISDALISRIVNKSTPWAVRGTPHLMRSFRTLMMEESLNAAQDAVSDRLYSPFILATLGVENLGDGEPWIPDQSDLEDCRDDMQNALSADFRLMVHNFGLKVESVFGRESVPRFDQDYERIDEKILQAWGIGKALISGGSGGPYASSALNREFVTQMMVGFQNQLKRHIIGRAEIIAEAQEHYDYEMKGSYRKPLYREIVETDDDPDSPTFGEEYITKVPKLLLPEIKFSTLNLRDEAQEREFIASLKEMGVPISDGTLAVNIPIKFKEELEKQSDEVVAKMVADAQVMAKTQFILDSMGLPYPEDLANGLANTLALRQQKAETEMAESQEELADQQAAMMSPAGQLGLLPGVPGTPPEPPEGEGDGPPNFFAKRNGRAVVTPPHANPPQARPPEYAGPEFADFGGGGGEAVQEVPRNRARPEESDEQRGSEPTEATGGADETKSARKLSKFEKGPSSYRRSLKVNHEHAERAVERVANLHKHQAAQNPDIIDLLHDHEFWSITNMQSYEGQIVADWPEIENGGGGASRDLLREAIDMYEIATGVEVTGADRL